jgi:hypothetical protein
MLAWAVGYGCRCMASGAETGMADAAVGRRGWLLAAVLVGACSLLAMGAPGALAAGLTYTVATSVDGPSQAGCAVSTNSCPTLRAAIQAADNNPGSTIQLGDASYQLTSVKGALPISANMTIKGLGPSETTIDQKYSGAGVITVSSGTTVAISGVSITGGTIHGAAGTSGSTAGGEADGGGISNAGTLTLTDDSVAGNTVTGGNAFTGGNGGRALGGGVANTGTLTLTGDDISGDSATGGAGSPSHGGGQGLGGGVDSTGTLTVIDSAFSTDASAGGTGGGGFDGGAFGGAIEQMEGKLTVERSTIGPANTAGTDTGGGIDSEGATTTIVNSTIFGNTAGTGGGLNTSADVSTSLASDTFDANTSQYGGGNIFNSTSGAIELSKTIVADGAGPIATGNCDDQAGAFVDGGHNLETDTASQCGLGGAGKSDLLVSSAFLPSALDANGGPTDTLALLPGAPEIGAGADCVDPSQTPPTTTLSVDQRGLPRPLAPATCDIGAFQTQLPVNTVAPKLSGVAQAGQALSCTPGTWTGDGPLSASGAVGALSYSYQWSRGAVAITGATASSYTARTADVGQQLSCKVTATGAYGHASAASTPTAKVTPAQTRQTTRSTLDDQQITLTTPSPLACTASSKKLGVTLNSATIAHSKDTKLKFASAAFYLDKGVKHTHKKTITTRTGRRKHVIVTSYSANTIAHHVPVTLELSIRALKPGTHTLTVKLSYKKREKRHGHEITVTVAKTLKVKFKVC